MGFQIGAQGRQVDPYIYRNVPFGLIVLYEITDWYGRENKGLMPPFGEQFVEIAFVVRLD